jgi:hypothetical protein
MKATVIIIVVTLLIFGGIFYMSGKDEQTPPLSRCVEHGGISMHIHPVLSVTVEGQKMTIPANIGVTPTCMSPVHTHDESGTLHLEYPTQHDFTLADFFTKWGQPFDSTQLMDKKVDDQHELIMTVDGQPSTEFEKLIMKDKQQISITYSTKTATDGAAGTVPANTNAVPDDTNAAIQ